MNERGRHRKANDPDAFSVNAFVCLHVSGARGVRVRTVAVQHDPKASTVDGYGREKGNLSGQHSETHMMMLNVFGVFSPV